MMLKMFSGWLLITRKWIEEETGLQMHQLHDAHFQDFKTCFLEMRSSRKSKAISQDLY